MRAHDIALRLLAGGQHFDVSLETFVDADVRESAAGAANQWIKALRHARVEGETLRDRFHYRGDSLWWFTELFLHKEGHVTAWFETIGAMERCLAAHAPRHVAASTASPDARLVLSAVCEQQGVAHDVSAQASAFDRLRARARMASRAQFYTWSARASRARPARSRPGARGGLVAFVHSAFWTRTHGSEASLSGQSEQEGYIGPVLQACAARLGADALTLVGVGPRVNFRARTWWHGLSAPRADQDLPFAPVEAFAGAREIAPSQAVWRARHRHERALLSSPDLRSAARVAGYDLWPLVARELRGVAHLQWPWSARAMDEAGAALDALDPSVVATYAEAGGWGRAIMLEARRRGIPSAGLQHGFIYRHWLNYLHAPDEMAPARPGDTGFPYPDRTLLFDAYAERHLRQSGGYPAEALRVTGNPRLDALVARVASLDTERLEAVRAASGARPSDVIVLVASKYTQIGRVFGALTRAAASMPTLRLVVKCHPAETAAPYVRDAEGFSNVIVAPASADLAALLAVARAVVTVNSTVAVDALVLGVPSLVVDLPNNLSPFVEDGVMLGSGGIDSLAADLRAVVDDGPARAVLLAGRRTFLDRYDIQADGLAAERTAEAIVDLRGGSLPTSVGAASRAVPGE